MPKKHPDWFMGDDERDFIINYGNEQAWQYIYDTLSYYIEKLDLSCYRQDYNIPYLGEFAEKNDTKDRLGLTEIKHIMGLYRLFDALRERFPKLLIDNCASGGRRIDIEMLSRSVAFFRSDYQCATNACPEVLQTHNVNVSRYLPLTGCTTKGIDDIYNMRSAYSPSFGCTYYCTIFHSMTDEKWEMAKKVNDEYLAIRHYLSCDFYNHGSDKFDLTSWAIWQYHDKSSGKGIVMAFRRPESPFETAKITLCGTAGAIIEYKNLDTSESFTGTSELNITLPKKKSSVIFEYKITK
jgi:alpha-galactosidase